jgi:hypothetical protein
MNNSQDPKKMKAVAAAAVKVAPQQAAAPAISSPVHAAADGPLFWRCQGKKALPLNERRELVMQLKKCIFC